MAALLERLRLVEQEGYVGANANAKLCQDIVLEALSRSSLNRHATLKGGVVMRSVTGNICRATRDIDLDFIRYSLSDESIDLFVQALNDVSEFGIHRIGEIAELKHQDYQGKQIFVLITDEEGMQIQSKVDLGVHRHLDLEQEEYCFDIAYSEDGAYLLINSKEQMFTEKLRSLLKFGRFSGRHKDVFDMYYLSDKLDPTKLRSCINTLIVHDSEMRENDFDALKRRAIDVLQNESFREAIKTPKKNWLEMETVEVLDGLVSFFRSLFLRNK